eukprot:119383_1
MLSLAVLVCSGIVEEQYYGWHILPTSSTLHTPKDHERTDIKLLEIKEYYDNIVFVPIITDMVDRRFGSDICDIIMDYYNQVIVMSCGADESFNAADASYTGYDE